MLRAKFRQKENSLRKSETLCANYLLLSYTFCDDVAIIRLANYCW